MTRFGKALLLIEIAVCFIPVSILLGLGVLLLPRQVWLLVTTDVDHLIGPLIHLASVASGVCGLVALYCVMRWILYGIRPNLKPSIVVILMCIGLAPLVFVALLPDVLWRFAVVLPLLCSAHLAWLSRGYLFADA